MKTVFLLRHAKASHDPAQDVDFERPLTRRGRRDAELLGVWMAENDHAPALIISSPTERTRDTALCCAEAANYTGEVRLEDALYGSDVSDYLELVSELDDTVESVMLVGHNPDISEVVEALSGAYHRMPTCALACIELPIAHWADLGEERGRLAWVYVPEEEKKGTC